jgi:hypothetical protein
MEEEFMKKFKSYIIVIIILLTFITPNCNAFNAYSVGSKFAEGTVKAGDDFTTNVTNAANAYKNLDGCNSYKSLISSYDYMKGSRLGSSQIYFINGHGSAEYITTAGWDKDNYRTGISIYDDGKTTYDSSGDKWIYAGLNGRDMSGTKLITFAGCSTASGSNNLVTKAVAQGAKTAVGFSDSIVSRFNNGPNWLLTYNTALSNQYSVKTSINKAVAAYPNITLSKYVVIKGSTSTVLGNAQELCSTEDLLTQTSSNIKSLDVPSQDADNNLSTIDGVYKNIPMTESIKIDISSKSNIDYSNESIIKIIDLIQNEDSEFDINNYIITYNIINEESGYGHIFLTYYIDETIETNKVYLIIVNNNTVEEIMLAGVQESNINNVDLASNDSLLQKVNEFEKESKSNIIYKKAKNIFNVANELSSSNILTKDNGVNINAISSDIKDYEEKYFYDYNTKELSYQLIMIVEEENYTFEGEMIESIIK